MKVYDAANIRNVALVGHSASGKTQLTSAALFDAGAVNRFGKVDEGTTITDYDDEEIARKHTLSAGLAYAEWNKTKINFIDTPGIANFLADTRAALRVAEAAVLVVDAVSGVQVQTEKSWQAAEEAGLPRLVVVNRLDRERASLERTLKSIHAALSRTVVPIQLPIGEEKSFRGVIDLVAQKACIFLPDGSGKLSESDIPADMAADAASAREALIEMVAEADETLMEKFFEAGTLTQEQLVAGSGRHGFGQIVSAAVHLGDAQHRRPAAPRCDCRLRAVARGPSLKMIDPKTGEELQRPFSDSGTTSAFVWKTIADPFTGRITMFRVMSGSLKTDSTVHNKTRDTAERLGHVVLLQGKTQTNVPELRAGDLGAVPKLKDTLTGDTLGDKSDPAVFPPLKYPEPVLSYAIEPKSRGDEDKISTSMHRLEEEDPSISYSRDPQTKELLLSGQGQLHIEVTVAKLKRRFGVDVNLKPPRIPYRETIKAPRKRTAATKSRPAARPVRRLQDQGGAARARSDFEFVDDIFGGSFRVSSSRPSKRASRKRACAAISPASRWSISASPCSTVRTTTSTRTSSRSRWPAGSHSRTR
jgi:elongation factor G